VDRQTVLFSAHLTVRARLVCVGHDPTILATKLKFWMLQQREPMPLGTLHHVGLHEELAPVPENAGDLVQHRVSREPPLLVALFPPGVREVHENTFDLTSGLDPRQNISRISGPHQNVAESTPGTVLANLKTELALDLDTQDAARGSLGCRQNLGALVEKQTPSEANLELHRTLTGYQGTGIKSALRRNRCQGTISMRIWLTS